MNEFEAVLREHEQQMEALTERYIGKNDLSIGRSCKDPWFKKQWYMNRIFELRQLAGASEQRSRRCKRTDTETWQRYDKIVKECRSVADHLMLEVLSLQQPSLRG